MARRTHPAALELSVAALLGALTACGAGNSTAGTALSGAGSDTGAEAPLEQVDGRASPSKNGGAASGDGREATSCLVDAPRTLTFEEPTTVAGGISVAAYLTPTDIVVARDGTGTVTYQSADDLVRTADDPPAAGDPLDPSGGRDETWLWPGDNLALDGTGTQTMAVQVPVRFNPNTFASSYDLVVADRPAGGVWSTTPVQVKEKQIDGRTDLAVNASGAAVLVWDENERHQAIYRSAAGAPWSSPQRVPAADAFDVDVAIDDAGRILLAYDRLYDDPSGGVYAIRRTRAGKWTPRRQLSGPGTELFRMALNPDGVAVVSFGPVDGDGASLGRLHTSRMTANGTWQASVRHPHSLGLTGLSLDERGRALIAGWDRTRLRGRWSRPDGTWRQPFTIAARVRHTGRWGLAPRVTMNLRGDALATWGSKTRTGEFRVRARFAPSDRDWTKTLRVTPTDQQPKVFDAALGDCGHAAVAWTTSTKPRQLHIRRATPSGKGG